jgi:two-component system, OmpR family, KDP operon response regulator KdpE
MMSNDRAAAAILVVDDEPEILRALRSGLTAQGYEVETAADGEEALRKANNRPFDLVILDILLPGGITGLDVCRRLREWSVVPILMLSALGQERQKAAALDLGADDYLTKPFGMNELTARVRAALRRYHSASAPDAEPPSVFLSDTLTVDYARRVVLKEDQEIRLTPLEYSILRYLTRNVDRVVTHRQLLASVWGPEYQEDTQLLRVHVGHLRQKIEDNPARPRQIVTEPGVGYRFRTTEPSVEPATGQAP